MIFENFKLSQKTINYDIVIVGAGIAGIILAMELGGAGKRVGLFESGGLEFDAKIQDLYKGELAGRLNHAPLDAYRMRFFGGSSNCWGGGCLPYDPIDFEKRPYLPRSGWPLQYSSLLPFYRRAVDYLEIDSFDFELDRKEVIGGISATGILQTKYWKRAEKSPNFKEKYFEFFKHSKTVDLYLNANLVRLEDLQGNGEIKSLYFKSYQKEDFKVIAKQYVLSMGGIENARLLLNSRALFLSPPLKKIYENIGKFYSPHINLMHGTFIPSPGVRVLNKYESITDKLQFRRFLTLTEDAINKYELLNPKTVFEEDSTEVAAPLSDEVYTYLYGNAIPGGVNQEIDQINSQIQKVFPSKLSNRLRIKRTSAYLLNNAFEQEPNWNSRIELNPEKDLLGLNRVRLIFNAKDSDIRRYVKYFELVAKTVGELGIGRLSYDRSGEVFYTQNECGASHHTGTTRMSLDGGQGVVDVNCKIHGIKNLYVASASVFPTPSQANPTFTIAALSIRLADYLIARDG
jgi:hypothetical protein